jgi:pimeloyl-ACP methyl ester carboxylesterase
MIRILEMGGRRLACWVNNGNFPRDRRTLVFIHGSGGNHTDWILQYTPLKASFNIAAIDLPGHGQSDEPGETDVAVYTGWVKRIVEDLGILHPILVGHSLGAAICLNFAILHGDAAGAVVPVGGGVRMPVNPVIFEGLREAPEAVIALAAKFSLAKPNRERLSDLITKALSRVNPSILHGDFLACNGLDITEAASRIRVPALVVCGAEDKMTPPALSEALSSLIPGASLALIPGAGHFAMLENPEAFNRVLSDFVFSLAPLTQGADEGRSS